MSGFHHRLIGVQHRPLNFYQTTGAIGSNQVGGIVVGTGGTTIVAISSGSNFFIRSSNGGTSWSASANIGTTLNTVASNAGVSNLAGSYDATILITGANAGLSRRSINSGVSWTNTLGIASDTYISPCCSSDAVIRFLAAGTTVFKSTDSGATWNSFSYSPAVSTQAMAISGNGVYVVHAPTGTNQLKVSNDSGSTWNLRGPSTTWGSICISFDGSVMIATAGTVLYRSTDFGVTWEALSYVPPSGMYSLCMSSDGMIIAGITDTGTINEVHLSLDSGINFVSTFYLNSASGFRLLKCDSTGKHFWMSRATSSGNLWYAKLELSV